MRYNKLDLNLLVALDHLLHLRNVSAAAEKMRITQSAMSNALARLRDYFGDEILVKVGRGLELTPRAEGLKDSVREVLARIDWTVARQPEFDPGQSERTFNLLVSDYTLTTLVPRMLSLCREATSRARFNFLHQVAGPERLLDRGDLDLLIIPQDFCSKSHPVESLLDERFCAIVASDGPFAGRKLTRKVFVNAAHVVMQTPDGAQSLESVYFRHLGVERRIEITTHSFASLPALVAGGDRIATVHERLAQRAKRLYPIDIQELPFRLPKMRQAMQWHKHRTQDGALAWLRGVLREAAATLD